MAEVHVPGVPAERSFVARPERWTTVLSKLWVAEIEVGDPVFDQRVYLRAEGGCIDLLREDGVQSSLLSLLSGTYAELAPNHVTLDGTQLTMSVRPGELISESVFLERQLDVAALALHIHRRLALPAA